MRRSSPLEAATLRGMVADFTVRVCSWMLIPAIGVGIASAVFFVIALDGDERGRLWASVAVYVASVLAMAVCSWRLFF